MRDSFIDYLASHSTLSAETFEGLRSMLRGAPEPMGIFTKPQLKSLLKVQEMRAAVETAEALALSGALPAEVIMAHLGEFFSQAREPQTI